MMTKKEPSEITSKDIFLFVIYIIVVLILGDVIHYLFGPHALLIDGILLVLALALALAEFIRRKIKRASVKDTTTSIDT